MKNKTLFKKILLIFICSISQLIIAQNYMKTWYLDNGKVIDYTAPVPTVGTVSGYAAATSAFVANGMYGNNNNLLFYVKDDYIINKFGTTLAAAPSNLSVISANHYENLASLKLDIGKQQKALKK